MRVKKISSRKISSLPSAPGVYFFWNEDQLLYIGKASNLKERIKDHFRQPNYKGSLFINGVKKIGYLILSSEIEALIEEAKLIKKYQPKFNILFRDDKNYFYVGITKENWPRVFITHQLNNKRQIKSHNLSANYIGPFTDGSALKEALKILRRTFPYRSCKKLPKRPCLYYRLNLCPAPCLIEKNFQRIPELKNQYLKLKKDYQKQIQYLKEVLEKGKKNVIKSLQKEMKKEAEKEEFERAVKLKKAIESLEKTFLHCLILTGQAPKRNLGKLLKKTLKFSRIPKRIEGYDISNIQEKEMVGSMVVFLQNKNLQYQPDKKWYRRFKIKTLKKQNDIGCLKEILKRRFSHQEWPLPDLIFIDGGRGQFNAAKEVCQKVADKKIHCLSLAKRKNIVYNNSSQSCPLDKLPQEVKMLILSLRDEAHRFAQVYHRLLRRKKYSFL